VSEGERESNPQEEGRGRASFLFFPFPSQKNHLSGLVLPLRNAPLAAFPQVLAPHGRTSNPAGPMAARSWGPARARKRTGGGREARGNRSSGEWLPLLSPLSLSPPHHHSRSRAPPAPPRARRRPRPPQARGSVDPASTGRIAGRAAAERGGGDARARQNRRGRRVSTASRARAVPLYPQAGGKAPSLPRAFGLSAVDGCTAAYEWSCPSGRNGGGGRHGGSRGEGVVLLC
jgi:hypothetical protein